MFSFNIVSRKLHQMFCCPLYHRGLKACKLPVTHFLLSWFLVTVFQGEALQVGRLEEGRRRFSLHDSGSGRLHVFLGSSSIADPKVASRVAVAMVPAAPEKVILVTLVATATRMILLSCPESTLAAQSPVKVHCFSLAFANDMA